MPFGFYSHYIFGKRPRKHFAVVCFSNGLKEPSYVFGTMHMMCDSSFEIKDKVKAAFNSCKQVYLEIDLDDPEEIKQMTTAVMGEKIDRNSNARPTKTFG